MIRVLILLLLLPLQGYTFEQSSTECRTIFYRNYELMTLRQNDVDITKIKSPCMKDLIPDVMAVPVLTELNPSERYGAIKGFAKQKEQECENEKTK